MSFFSRLSDIVTSNINTFLETAENPEATINQIVAEMEKGVEAARRSAAAALTRAKRLKSELDQSQAKMAFWKEKAREAVELARDDLARRALSRRREIADLAGALEDQVEAAIEQAEHLKITLRALEARLAEAIRQREAYRTGGAPPAPKPTAEPSDDLQDRIDRLEREIEAAEAEVVSGSDEPTDDQWLGELDDREDLEHELAALKSELTAKSS